MNHNKSYQPTRKLTLQKETLRVLTAAELARVAGGLTQALGCTDTARGLACLSDDCFSLSPAQTCFVSKRIQTGCGMYTQ